MDFSYTKRSNTLLFDSFKKKELLNVSDVQNYVPIYSTFFSLKQNNYNSINLNNCLSLHSIRSKLDENAFLGKIMDTNGKLREKNIFFKFSPLLDHIKYMVGKYDTLNIFKLPILNGSDDDNTNTIVYKKMNDANNSAYVDSFFSFLSSKLLHTHNFINGIDFYGSYLAVKNSLNVNVYDDMELLIDSDFFYKNNGGLFTVNQTDVNNHLGGGNDTREFKRTIRIHSIHDEKVDKDEVVKDTDIEEDVKDDDIILLETLSEVTDETKSCVETDEDEMDSEVEDSDTDDDEDNEEKIVEPDNAPIDSDNSQVSDYEYENSDSIHLSDYDIEEDEEDEEDEVSATIHSFPVQLIALEKCDDTLDSYISSHKLSDDELDSIIIQILMSLITFQKTFGLTHNDLHTNNIMYVRTNKKHLYYLVGGKQYKIKTFGKIYKIIDFGRAIYSFNGNIICSDSFSKNGDAATQYNCIPYLNINKPVIEPNYSFDLCRLGCSLFDVFVDSVSQVQNVTSPIIKIILSWCLDDNNKNIMYKRNGDERYPDFKLYKMIARTVHNHVPATVLENKYFDKFIIEPSSVKKIYNVMNIDKYPSYK
jgi:hypothetical protein